MGMRFGIWSVRRLYKTGSLKTVTSEVAKYNLDQLSVQEVRWDRGGSETADDYVFLYGNGNDNHQGIISPVRKVKSVSNKMSYTVLRCRCSDMIFLNVHAPTEDKRNDMKDSLYGELECVFDLSINSRSTT
jgi:hypothetical protein